MYIYIVYKCINIYIHGCAYVRQIEIEARKLWTEGASYFRSYFLLMRGFVPINGEHRCTDGKYQHLCCAASLQKTCIGDTSIYRHAGCSFQGPS